MVMHPAKGVFLVGDASRREGQLTAAPPADVGLIYGTLMRHRFTLSEPLADLPALDARPLPIGEAVIVAGQPTDSVEHPDQVPPKAVFTRDDLADFPACLDRAFDFYTWPACEPVSEYGDQLVEGLLSFPDAHCKSGDWFIDIHKSVDHDLALLEEMTLEHGFCDGEGE